MKTLKLLWKKITQSNAIENSSGELETLFFESVYRVTYILGFSMSDGGLYMLYSAVVKFTLSLFFISEMVYILVDFVDFDDLAASVNVTILQIISFYRYRNMLSHNDLYRKLTKAMESKNFDISTENRKKIVEHWSIVNENYLKIILGIGNFTLCIWFIYPLVDELEYNLIVGVTLPFDYRTPRAYAAAYISTVVIFYYVSHFVMVADVRMKTFLLHIICQFNVLADCFENIVEDSLNEIKDAGEDPIDKKNIQTGSFLNWDNNFQEKYKKRLSGYVEQHKSLLRLTLDLRTSLSGPMLGQLATSSVLICFIGYQAAMTATENITKCLMSLFFLAYNLFGFYVICRWCEEIKTQTESIGTAVYCSGWEAGVAVIPTVRPTLMLVIARANNPVIMTAGGMYDLSLMSYSSLVKTSYSALTVLLRFRN